MGTMFIICAAIGGTILLLQLAMTLAGLGGHGLDADVSHDFGGHLGGFDHDLTGDLSGDTASDLHGDTASGHDYAATDHDAQQQSQHGSTWLFGVLSMRTIVAALTFFGLAGLTARSAGASPLVTLATAVAAGAGAMYGVYWLMRGLYSLRAEGTVRIQRALGQPANVYLKIPSQRGGAGKVHLNLQNRTVEYQAVTSGEGIPTGAQVQIVGILSGDTVEVRPLENPERN